MALQNAGSSTSTYQWYTSDSGNPTGTYITGVDNIMSDKDGYTHSECLQTTGYAAGIAAKGYMAKDRNGNTVATPSGTSGWYLPSIGQWYDICARLGGMVIACGKSYTCTDNSSYIRWYSEDDNSSKNYSSICVSNLNAYLNTLKEKEYSIDPFSNNNEHYWSSSEHVSSLACYVDFNGNGSVYLANNADKVSSRIARPVIAF